jgi:protein-disulfide isomerase
MIATWGDGTVACCKNLLVTMGLAACVLGAPCRLLGQRVSKDKEITRQQAEEILDELKQIHALLEKIEKRVASRGFDSSTKEAVKVKIDDGYSMGQKDAPLTLVEFADYQCPFCKHFHTTTFQELRTNYIDTGKLRFVALDFPLDTHRNAMQAATAALCAGEQYKFWEMRDLLITHADKLEEQSILDYAKDLQLDTGLLKACLASDRYASKIKNDIAQAEAAGISGTPSFVLGKTAKDEVEGTKIVGALPYSEFEVKIQRLLATSQ